MKNKKISINVSNEIHQKIIKKLDLPLYFNPNYMDLHPPIAPLIECEELFSMKIDILNLYYQQTEIATQDIRTINEYLKDQNNKLYICFSKDEYHDFDNGSMMFRIYSNKKTKESIELEKIYLKNLENYKLKKIEYEKNRQKYIEEISNIENENEFEIYEKLKKKYESNKNDN